MTSLKIGHVFEQSFFQRRCTVGKWVFEKMINVMLSGNCKLDFKKAKFVMFYGELFLFSSPTVLWKVENQLP